MSRRWDRVSGILAGLILFNAAPCLAADNDEQRREAMLQVCRSDTGPWDEAIQWVRDHQRQPPGVPVPPKLAAPCHQCDDNNDQPSESEQLADAWIEQSTEPEATKIKTLLAVGHDWATVTGGSNALPEWAPTCIAHFSESEAMNNAFLLVDRLYAGKALPMAQQYKSDPERAYAGIRFLLAVARQRALLGGASTDEDLALAGEWVSNAIDQGQRQMFQEHKYQLCPTYLALFRKLGELTGDSRVNIDEYIRLARRMQEFMHFKVELDFDGQGAQPDAGYFKTRWRGTADLELELHPAQGCYTPKLAPDNALHVSVLSYEGQDQDGNAVSYVGPHDFTLPVSSIKLNLCGQQPQVELKLERFGPEVENIIVDGHPGSQHLLEDLFHSLLTLNLIHDSGLDQAQSRAAANQDRIQALQNKVRAHQGDQNWFFSPEGQRTIQEMNQVTSDVMGNAAATLGGGAGSLTDPHPGITWPWVNGRINPVDDNKDQSRDRLELHLKTIFQQHTVPGG
jgi:hypothetical protein